MTITTLPAPHALNTKLRYSDQVEVMLDMLIQSGYANPDSGSFILGHDDVMIVLELIRERLIDMKDL